LDFREDLFAFDAPLISFRLLAHAGEAAVAYGVLSNIREETLRQIEPRTAGRREVKWM
jgi:hypothetical protein